MSITIFQLMNNYYQDNIETKRGTQAKYSTFGYFDGLIINHVSNINNSIEEQNIEFNISINNLIVAQYDAVCNRRNIVCYTDDEEKSKTFWKNSEQALYLFLSLVRINIKEKKDIEEIIEDINKKTDMLCVYSYNHNELALIYYNNKYYDGMVSGIDMCNKIQGEKKVYTISSFNEEIIKEGRRLENTTENELVAIQFKCSVKDYSKLSDFISELGKEIGKKPIDFQIYDVFGNDDVLIEIEEVCMINLLKCYLADGILNHSNKNYSDCFYNVESQIIKRRWENGCLD